MMNRETVLSLLIQYGANTSPATRAAAGITAKATNISGRMSELCASGFAKKKAGPSGNVYSVTPKGRQWLDSRQDNIESIDVINATDFSKPKKSKTTLPTTATEERAIEGIVGIIDENKSLRATLEGIYLQLGQVLGK